MLRNGKKRSMRYCNQMYNAQLCAGTNPLAHEHHKKNEGMWPSPKSHGAMSESNTNSSEKRITDHRIKCQMLTIPHQSINCRLNLAMTE